MDYFERFKMNTSSKNVPRKMRLGTRSCAECRRRKVRCIFPHQSQTCLECASHDTPCRKQGLSTPSSADGESGPAENVQRRLEDLEEMVRGICNAVNINMETSSLADFQTTTAEALKRLALPSPSIRKEGDAFEGQTDSGQSDSRFTRSTSDDIGFSSDRADSFEDAPLLSLFKKAMVLQRSDEESAGDTPDFAVKRQISNCIRTLKTLIPKLDDLILILNLTAKYWALWPVWPLAPSYPVGDANSQQFNQVAQGRDFIFGSLQSGNATTVAKAILWLAMCVQQLPATFNTMRTALPAPPTALIDSYLDGADCILAAINAESGSSIEALESYLLEAKLYINMGRPKKAWLCVRRAMNAATLLGLHRPESLATENKRKLWMSIWQYDRQLSLVLGFPNGISDSHPSLSLEYAGESIILRIMHGVSLIAGHISDRNNSTRRNDYSLTLQIEQELNQWRDLIPRDWWDVTPDPSLPLPLAYIQRTSVFYCCSMYKNLHFPFMLNSSSSNNYEHSRLVALASSRQLIRAYDTFRGSSQCAMVICDLMDFQAFSAAMVLAIGLISAPPLQSDAYQDAADWALIEQLIKNLQHVSQAMECSVAEQAAQVLQHIMLAHQGLYSDTEAFETTIPYFGKVRISLVPQAQQYGENSVSSVDLQTTTFDTPGAFSHSNSIEISADSFAPFGLNPGQSLAGEEELSADWTEALDQNLDFDWNQVFYDAGSLTSMGSNLYM